MGPKSICDLIKVSHQCGVSRLKLGDLEIRFFGSARQPEPQHDDFSEIADSSARDSAPMGEGYAPPKVPKDLVERFADEQQLIDDPLAFEDALIDQHLNRATGSDEAT